jgi:hypothetical protein
MAFYAFAVRFAGIVPSVGRDYLAKALNEEAEVPGIATSAWEKSDKICISQIFTEHI